MVYLLVCDGVEFGPTTHDEALSAMTLLGEVSEYPIGMFHVREHGSHNTLAFIELRPALPRRPIEQLNTIVLHSDHHTV